MSNSQMAASIFGLLKERYPDTVKKLMDKNINEPVKKIKLPKLAGEDFIQDCMREFQFLIWKNFEVPKTNCRFIYYSGEIVDIERFYELRKKETKGVIEKINIKW